MQEISLTEAARRLKRAPSTIAKLAMDIEGMGSKAAQMAIRSRYLPGRKVGRTWLFRPEHVSAFAKIKRPVGRPAAR